MLRAFRLCLFLSCSLALAACAGGGGGAGSGIGGGGGIGGGLGLVDFAGGAAAAGDSHEAASLSEAIGAGPAAGLTAADPGLAVNGFYYLINIPILGIFSNGTVRMETVGNNLVVQDSINGSISLSPQDITVFENGLTGVMLTDLDLELTTGNTGIANTSAVMQENIVAMLGGNTVGLEYSNFGFWEDRIIVRGEIGNVDIDTELSFYEPFTFESTNAVVMSPAARSSFSGVVLANAYSNNDVMDSKSVSLIGEANLDMISANEFGIEFVFDNFYTISFDNFFVGNGNITSIGNDSVRISDSYKNTTGIYLNENNSSSYLGGQFYGGAGDGSATEAVGFFYYGNDPGIGVRGAFGVKQ